MIYVVRRALFREACPRVFRNVTEQVDSFSKIIDRTELQKIARQFHTSPFSLWCRDGGQKKGGRFRKARKAFRTNYRRTVAQRREHPSYGPGGSPKTNYSDKPNYLPLLLRPFPTCPIKSGQVATKFSISRSRKPGRCRAAHKCLYLTYTLVPLKIMV